MTEIRVPTLGESVTEATVATWFKSPGDTVTMDEMLCELETDKVTVEVPATVEGTLSEIIAKEGDTVGVDAILAIISASEKQTSKEIKAEEKAASTHQESTEKITSRSNIEHSPSAKKLLKENDIDSSQVSGTGRDGRIMKEDVQAALKNIKDEPTSLSQIPTGSST